MSKISIKSQTRDEVASLFKEWNLPMYRVDQVFDWIYRRRVGDWQAMTNLPAALRERMAGQYSLTYPSMLRRQGQGEGAVKFLWGLADHSAIESVLIPANPALYGENSDRHTLCISTQVGCAYGCKFCASGLKGWKRNLTADEIVDQVLASERWGRGEIPDPDREPWVLSGEQRVVDNVVVMGMGEPFANYDNLMKALAIINGSWGCGIGSRKITVSTSGLAPEIKRFADEVPQYRLAVSLHGATDEVRGRIMPVNRKYPLSELMAACDYYQERKGRMITFEYILISGVNDALDQVPLLAGLARRANAKVNLIPYNRVAGLPWESPDQQVCEAFASALDKQRIPVTLRLEKGKDIDAACGQLRLRVEGEEV